MCVNFESLFKCKDIRSFEYQNVNTLAYLGSQENNNYFIFKKY